MAKILHAANIKDGETVLEIGPGTGILTGELLKSPARKIVAVEKDDEACGMLEKSLSNEIFSGRLSLIHGDILETDLSSAGLNNGKYRVVANIPYYITGAILESFLEYEPRPDRMVLLVQKEVADRILARDGKESVLSISVKAFGRPRLVAKVPRGAFNPPPKVDSAILAIDDISDARFGREMTGAMDIGGFFATVKAGFAHKRKLLKRNLEAVMNKKAVDEAWMALGLPEKARAENINLEQWRLLASRTGLTGLSRDK